MLVQTLNGLNVSIIAYCDDILLMSPVATYIEELLNECSKYAADWKLEFKSSKSEAATVSSKHTYRFSLNNKEIPNAKSSVSQSTCWRSSFL